MNDEVSKVKGDVKETLGAVTGDRRVEAEGRAEQRAAKPDDPLEQVTDEVIEHEEDDVRKERHDVE
jgi:uncharacterized protein YjbJ (UPF0337 family)